LRPEVLADLRDTAVKAITIGFHDVADDGRELRSSDRPGVALYTLSAQAFREHLIAIRDREVSISAIHGFRLWRVELPVFLTFDDGALNGYTSVAVELEQYGWRGHFFITTDWIGRDGFMNPRQIRELHDRGHVIGSHSCSHPARMSQLKSDALITEWRKSTQILSEIVGEPVRLASVPDGYYSARVAQAAAAAGIEVLFNSEPTMNISIVDRCMVLGRYSIQKHMEPGVSGALASGAAVPRLRQSGFWALKKAVKVLTGDSYLVIRRHLLAHFMKTAPVPDHAGKS
jgi:peptidoglycan/xylan/chitin deacetylase (PgdA/CDA1 family)